MNRLQTRRAPLPPRKKFHERIVLPLSKDMLAQLDEAREDQMRVAFIREAVERELARRRALAARETAKK